MFSLPHLALHGDFAPLSLAVPMGALGRAQGDQPSEVGAALPCRQVHEEGVSWSRITCSAPGLVPLLSSQLGGAGQTEPPGPPAFSQLCAVRVGIPSSGAHGELLGAVWPACAGYVSAGVRTPSAHLLMQPWALRGRGVPPWL